MMKKWKQLLVSGIIFWGMWIIAGAQAEASVPVDEANFPDVAVRAYVQSIDKDKNGVLSDQELRTPTYFSFGLKREIEEYGANPGTVVNFKGMENFTNIKDVSLYDVGTGNSKWNYTDSNLLRYFPYATRIKMETNFTASSETGGKISLAGTSDSLQELEIITPGLLKWDVKAKNLSNLIIQYADTSNSGFSLAGFPSLKTLTIRDANLRNSGLSLQGLSMLECINLVGSNYNELDLSPVKKTLKTLYIGDHWEADDTDTPDEGSSYLKKLDISQMEKLENVWAGYTGITKLITKDSQGKSNTKKLKELYLAGCKIKSIDVSAMPNLEKLYLPGTSISKLNVTKNTKLKELSVSSSSIKSINLKKNVKLDTLVLGGKIKNLNLSKNTSLRALRLNTGKLKKLILPMPKKSVKWGARNKSFASGYVGRGTVYKTAVLDLSQYSAITKKARNNQISILKKCGIKKIYINKKLKKSDKKWIKKKAQKVKAKLIEK